MPSVQEVYNLSSTKEFTELVTMCNYSVHTEDGIIAIVKATPACNKDVRPPVRGLIFRLDTGAIIAPGIFTPKDVDAAADIPPDSMCWSMALDGIQIRIYRYDGAVHWSTAGMFNPTEGHWGTGSKTFGSLFADVSTQINYDAIVEGLCYYAILEHSDYLSAYRPSEQYAMLTLVRVTDMNGSNCNLLDHQDAFLNILEVKTGSPSVADLAFLEQDLPPGPVYYDTYGIMVYYSNMEMVRVLSLQARKAISMAPNMPNVGQHWIHCVWSGGYPIIDLYTRFFPWRTEIFEHYTSKLMEIYGEDLNKVTKSALRDIVSTSVVPVQVINTSPDTDVNASTDTDVNASPDTDVNASPDTSPDTDVNTDTDFTDDDKIDSSAPPEKTDEISPASATEQEEPGRVSKVFNPDLKGNCYLS